MTWMPLFACVDCASPLIPVASRQLECAGCGSAFQQRDGIWRFLAPAREQRLKPFALQYRIVREKEGRRRTSASYYRGLPNVAPDDPHVADWRVRQETYRHLLGHVLAAADQPSAVLDLGAGSAWLSHRLASLGHHVVAVDAIDDEVDGLGAVRHYETRIVAVQADFDALPFVPAQFDVVLFNGSLHYSSDPSETLRRAHRMLGDGGTLAVMDSPMFTAERDGTAMVREAVRKFASECGLREIVQPGCGYLTFATLDAAASRLQMNAAFVPSRGPLSWRVRRQLARVRLRRQPAAFGLWVAR